MATYIILCLPFLLVAVALSLYARKFINWNAALAALAVLTFLTAIFDNLIINLNIVKYDFNQIAGVFIGLAPLEDFSYTLFALFFTICVWKILEVKFKI